MTFLGGMDEQFALSYIENSITSNPVLAPMAVREMDDIYKLIRMAKRGEHRHYGFKSSVQWRRDQ